MYASVGAFVAALEAAGELHRVRVPVSPFLEVTEIVQRQCRSACPHASAHARGFDPAHADRGGKALLFEKVEGCDVPLLINAYGSYRRMEMALGADLDAIAARLEALTHLQPPRSAREFVGRARQLLPLLRVAPRRARRALCQEVVRLTARGEVDLTRLPHLRCWPLDGDPAAVGHALTPEQAGTAAGLGRYVTFAGVHTIHARDEVRARPPSHNIGMYRVQLAGPTRMVVHWHLHHDGAAHWRSWKRAGRPMPIALCFGGESVLPYAATAPLPPGIGELLMAGFLHGRGIPLVPARTVPLRVPANSEIVIEGWVSTECGPAGYDPGSGEPLGPGAAYEGPFGDHTGFYSLPDRYPVLEVSAVTHRRNALYPATVVGLPPQEDYYLGKATERIFLPLLRTLVPDLLDYHLPRFGCFHNCAFLKIRKEYPLQARRVMHATWGAGQMAWTKMVVVVDEDVDVHDEEAVWRAVFEHTDFGSDLELVRGPLDILDHAAPQLGAGHKLGIDATRKLPGEHAGGATPTRSSRAHARAVYPAFGRERCLFLGVEKTAPGEGVRALAEVLARGEADFAVAVDAGVDLHDTEAVLFHWCANCDPGRDLVAHGHAVGFDATAKVPGDARNGHAVRPYPPLLAMDPDTCAKVDARWREYGFA